MSASPSSLPAVSGGLPYDFSTQSDDLYHGGEAPSSLGSHHPSVLSIFRPVSQSESMPFAADSMHGQFFTPPDDDGMFHTRMLSSSYMSTFDFLSDSRRPDPPTAFQPVDQTPSPETTMLWESMLDYDGNTSLQGGDGGDFLDQTMELPQELPTNMGGPSMGSNIYNLWGDISTNEQFRTQNGHYDEETSRKSVIGNGTAINHSEMDSNLESRAKPAAPQPSNSTRERGREAQSTSPPSSQPGSFGNQGDAGTQMTCINCLTQSSPLWHRDPQGQSLCNACGFFFKIHGDVRPPKKRLGTAKDCNRCTKRGFGVDRRIKSKKNGNS